MPVFEALDRAARSSRETVEVLRRHAPTWLAQMPWLLEPDEVRGLEATITDATRARMLREMSRTLEVLAAERPLVLVLEDLHWADAATVDLLASIARRTDPAQLIVLGSYRPVEAIAYDHPIVPLVRALAVNGVCTRLGLESLGRADVHEYLERRFSAPELAASLDEPLHRRSEGNPLFLVAIVDWLVERGLVAEGSAGWQLTQAIDENDLRDIPRSLREMIELQLNSLERPSWSCCRRRAPLPLSSGRRALPRRWNDPEQDGVDAVDEACERLIARRQLLRAAGEETWPDGTRTARYAFRHELYRQVLYESLPASRRRRLHRRIGERMEQAFAGDLRRVAADLARHFDCSGDDAKAVAYFVLAARQAHRRYADREAAEFLAQRAPPSRQCPSRPRSRPPGAANADGRRARALARRAGQTGGRRATSRPDSGAPLRLHRGPRHLSTQFEALVGLHPAFASRPRGAACRSHGRDRRARRQGPADGGVYRQGNDRVDARTVRPGGGVLRESARSVWRGHATRLRRLSPATKRSGRTPAAESTGTWPWRS